MNRRNLAALAAILVLSGVAALAGGRHLGNVTRTDHPAAFDMPVVQPTAVVDTTLNPLSAAAVAE